MATKPISNSSDQIITSKQSLPESLAELSNQLYLTAENARVQLNQYLITEFQREFGLKRPEQIRWVGEEWRRRSPYMPAVCDWYALFAEYRPPVLDQSTWPDGKFRSCNNCNDGFLVSKTEKGNDAVSRCECWWQYLCEKLAVGRAELTQALKDREVERNKRGQRR